MAITPKNVRCLRQGLQGVPHGHRGEVCGEDDSGEAGSGGADRAAQAVQAANQPLRQHGQSATAAG